MTPVGRRRVCREDGRARSGGPVSPVTVGFVLLAVTAGGLVAMLLSTEGDSRSTGVEAARIAQQRQATAFYSNVRRSLTPLLNDAPRLSALLDEIASGTEPRPAVSNLAEQWADNFATARDLVGRLPPLGQRWAQAARALYHLGASVYVEAARGVPRIVEVASRPEQRREALKAARRLQLLGDRLFDAGSRLLRGEESTERSVEVSELLPPPVPDFADEALAAGEHAAGPTIPTATSPDQEVTSPSRWLKRHQSDIAGAVRKLSHPPDWWLQQHASSDVLGMEAQSLEEQVGLLGAPLPAGHTAQEGLHGLRLALLIGAESIRALAWADDAGGPDLEASRRLWLLAERLWAVAGDLLVSAGVGTGSLYALTPSGLDPELLDPGGIFHGNPPPLRPGDDPGKDVPGGLPALDMSPPAR